VTDLIECLSASLRDACVERNDDENDDEEGKDEDDESYDDDDDQVFQWGENGGAVRDDELERELCARTRYVGLCRRADARADARTRARAGNGRGDDDTHGGGCRD